MSTAEEEEEEEEGWGVGDNDMVMYEAERVGARRNYRGETNVAEAQVGMYGAK
jgi:hypothetical protein